MSVGARKLDALQIERRQVKGGRKNATDHGLIFEAAEMAADGFFPYVNVIIIVSADGDFVTLRDQLETRGKYVYVMGNRAKTSPTLQASGYITHYLEDLTAELTVLEQRYPVVPQDVRKFLHFARLAYFDLSNELYVWISQQNFETRLRELYADFETQFGKYSLSALLKSVAQEFEYDGQQVRRIDAHLESARYAELVQAFDRTEKEYGKVSLSNMGKNLRQFGKHYEHRFGKTKLSVWIREYPEIFKIEDGYVNYVY
ncbi:MAG: NYN domain-containing protein [Chloroflexi bacterium]|uniref:NYN domain-containing protein n=1 Tax=Candidatus Flexifilum breve TaxID=3140694 RepID=UPI0031371C08|nr:NYN domain-containing protein [Chloroflexota bacterium]